MSVIAWLRHLRAYLSRHFPFQRVLCAVVALICVAGVDVTAWAQFETRATTPFPQGRFPSLRATLTTTANDVAALTTTSNSSVSILQNTTP
jgi:hypothetical protein